MRRIAAITGSRADYGLMAPVMRAISNHKDLEGFHLSLDVSDEDGPRSVAVAIVAARKHLRKKKPDIVVLLGDRYEIFGAAIAASLSGIPLVHIHGGDKTRGGHDESMRHAITKLAHLHFAATAASAGRIMAMGERPEHVWVVGSPAIDDIRGMKWTGGKYIVVLQHSISTSPHTAAEEMRRTLEAVCKRTVVVIRPNSDPGSELVNKVIDEYKILPNFHVHDGLSRPDFLKLLCGCACLVGNSSAGIIECSYLGVPAVNVGSRQAGREQGNNVLNASHDTEAIKNAIAVQTMPGPRPESMCPYGDGHASEKIAEVLATVDLGPELIQKRIQC